MGAQLNAEHAQGHVGGFTTLRASDCVDVTVPTSLAHALAYGKQTQNGYRVDAHGYLIANVK